MTTIACKITRKRIILFRNIGLAFFSVTMPIIPINSAIKVAIIKTSIIIGSH